MINRNSNASPYLQFIPLRLKTETGQASQQALLPFATLSTNERWLYDILCWAQGQPDLHAARYCVELGRQLTHGRRYRAAWPALETALLICCRQATSGLSALAEETLSALSSLLDNIVDQPGASKYLERALVLWRYVRGPAHPETGELLNNLGYLRKQEARLDEARNCYEQALAIWQETLSPEHPSLAAVHNNLGAIARQAGRAQEARQHYEKATAISRAVHGQDHPATGTVLANLAAACHDAGDDDSATRYLEQSLPVLEKAGKSARRELAAAYNNMGHLLQSRKQYAQARHYLRYALALYKQLPGTSPLELASVLSNLGSLYRFTGEFNAALQTLGCAYLLHCRTLGPQHPHAQATSDALQQLVSATGAEPSPSFSDLFVNTPA